MLLRFQNHFSFFETTIYETCCVFASHLAEGRTMHFLRCCRLKSSQQFNKESQTPSDVHTFICKNSTARVCVPYLTNWECHCLEWSPKHLFDFS